MKEIITNLLKVKSIITLVLLGLLVYAVIHGIIEGKFLETVITMVFSFYFGTQYQKGVQQKETEDEQQRPDKL